MANSVCPKCNHSSFELKPAVVKGANFKMNFIQCSSCGAVVGVMDYWAVGHTVQEIKEEIDKFPAKFSAIAQNQGILEARLIQIENKLKK